MNRFEQQVVNALRRNMSKREAEQALYWIREGIYGDSYHQIRPHLEIEDIIEAYNSDDYTVLRNELGIEDKEDIKEQDEDIDLKEADSFLHEEFQDISQNNPHHFGTVIEHTDKVVEALPKDCNKLLKLAALYHDIGKPEVVSINPKTGYDQFIGHAQKSVEILEDKGLLPEDKAEAEYVKELVKLHDTKYSKQGKCKTLLDEHPNGFAKDLIALQYADIIGQSEYMKYEKLSQLGDFVSNLKAVGTPEQTEGLDDMIKLINNERRSTPHYENHNDALAINEELIIKEEIEHTALTDKDIKFTNLDQLEELSSGSILPRYTSNDVEVSFYGGNLASITIGKNEIEDLFEIEECSGPDDDLCYRITDEALQYTLDKINENENRTKNPYIEPGEKKMFEKVWLARTAGNQDVYIGKDTYEHMQAHPDVSMAHIVEAIGKMKDYNGQFRIGPIDLERLIGKDNCIERTDDMQIDMLVRKGRDGQTPVVLLDKNEVEAQDTSKITIGLCKDDDGRDTMFTAFYGGLAPKEPWDRSIQDNPEKLAESKDFWDTHALIQTSDVIDWEKSKEFQASNQIEAAKEALDAVKSSIEDSKKHEEFTASPGIKEQAAEMRDERNKSISDGAR